MTDSSTTKRLTSYVEWMRISALPTWADRGWDQCAGRFRERLTWTGEALAVPHRSMVQARQIYVFARAAKIGWFDQGGDLADGAMASLLRDFGRRDEDGFSVAFSIDPCSRTTLLATRDAYTHAFVLFALAALFALDGDPQWLHLADEMIRFIDLRLTDHVHGGLFDALPIVSATKRQNPHMHLLEAYLALEQAAPGRGYGARVRDLVSLFEERFFSMPPGILLEHFSADWSAPPNAAMAGIWEPGHHLEWVWLLAEARNLTGVMIEPRSEMLYDMARRHGTASNGRLYDEASRDLRVIKSSHRLWPHTEAIKAAVVRSGAGDGGAPAFADLMAQHLLDTFLDRPFAGGWVDHVAADGTPLVNEVPASSLYHLFFASSEASKLLTLVNQATSYILG